MTNNDKANILYNFCDSKSIMECEEGLCELHQVCEDTEYQEFSDMEEGLLNTCLDKIHHSDMVNSPPHYTNGGMECIDEMILVFGKETVANFCLCNAWKYRYRALFKNGQEDVDKSHWYIKKYKELVEGGL